MLRAAPRKKIDASIMRFLYFMLISLIIIVALELKSVNKFWSDLMFYAGVI